MLNRLYEARARYTRLLMALSLGRRVDRRLRIELEGALRALDRKIMRGAANTARHERPDS